MVFWGYDPDPNVGARCWTYTTGGYNDGFDIRMNNRIEWTTSLVQDVATHEFGHVLEINDLYENADSGQTTYHTSSSGDDSLEWGDIAGIQYLYPDDDKPTVSILDPDPNDSVGSQVYVRATVSCVDPELTTFTGGTALLNTKPIGIGQLIYPPGSILDPVMSR